MACATKKAVPAKKAAPKKTVAKKPTAKKAKRENVKLIIKINHLD